MTKNLKLSFILCLILSGVVVAWHSMMGFWGAGINFVAMLTLASIMLIICLTDGKTKSRFLDLFIISCVFVGLEFLIYLVFEFNIGDLNTKYVFFVFQNVYSVLGLLFFAYTIFRFVVEAKEARIPFVEALLGNRKSNKKNKKELKNGSLIEKPNVEAETSEQENAPSTTQNAVDSEENKEE